MDQDKTVNLRAYKCVCTTCGHQFIDGDFTCYDYGYRIFRTKGGKHCALWIGFEDECFQEFELLMRKVIGSPMPPRSEALLFDKIFGVSCDPIQGVPIDPSQGRVCPKCGSDDVDTFDIVPKQIISKTLPLVKHTLWLKKGPREREQAIHAAMLV